MSSIGRGTGSSRFEILLTWWRRDIDEHDRMAAKQTIQ